MSPSTGVVSVADRISPDSRTALIVNRKSFGVISGVLGRGHDDVGLPEVAAHYPVEPQHSRPRLHQGQRVPRQMNMRNITRETGLLHPRAFR
ncbi:hypothetical protein [Hoyosella subflava]|uniref:Uncharacterized protein n=1 Tax=Hoyosella subflava (strain DSM 45089 / JCM 17490 / NBRC 109087 / DQS3-9A1) TaxID=443218 RepID=F6ELK0_HOYSD|nr:hypothetical protein [Hoyosella subflava]AEF40250.1 hypothetical protein AS9A_1801 [Hoyosella subflava DQS3-9A1]